MVKVGVNVGVSSVGGGRITGVLLGGTGVFVGGSGVYVAVGLGVSVGVSVGTGVSVGIIGT